MTESTIKLDLIDIGLKFENITVKSYNPLLKTKLSLTKRVKKG